MVPGATEAVALEEGVGGRADPGERGLRGPAEKEVSVAHMLSTGGEAS